MKTVYVEGLTVGAATKRALVSYIRDLTKRVIAGEVVFDPKWSLNRNLRVLGKMLKIAREM